MRHAEMAAQVKSDEKLNGAVAFDGDSAVLVNVANGVLRVTENEVSLLKHDPSYHFTGCLRAAWDDQAESPHFFRVVVEALPVSVSSEGTVVFHGAEVQGAIP